MAPRATVIALNGEYVAIEPDKLNAVTMPDLAADPVLAAPPRKGGPLYRRIAKVMLGRADIRSIWPSRQQAVAWTECATPALQTATTFATSATVRDLRAPRVVKLPVPNIELFAVRANTKGAQPSMLTTFTDYKYNLVEYDGLFYGLPYGLEFDWNDPNSASLPGVIVAESAQKAMRQIREQTQSSGPKKPRAVAERGQRAGGRGCQGPAIARRDRGLQLGELRGIHIRPATGARCHRPDRNRCHRD